MASALLVDLHTFLPVALGFLFCMFSPIFSGSSPTSVFPLPSLHMPSSTRPLPLRSFSFYFCPRILCGEWVCKRYVYTGGCVRMFVCVMGMCGCEGGHMYEYVCMCDTTL